MKVCNAGKPYHDLVNVSEACVGCEWPEAAGEEEGHVDDRTAVAGDTWWVAWRALPEAAGEEEGHVDDRTAVAGDTWWVAWRAFSF